MLNRVAPRPIYTGLAVSCFGLIGFALYLQHVQGLEPCPLCILQRVAFIAAGALALVGVVSWRAARSRWLPALLALPVLAGLSAAGRHVWLERFPPQSTSCSPADLNYILETVPLAEILPKIFRGSGDCGTVLWRFLGLSIAEWSLLWLLALLVVAVLLQLRAFSDYRR
jgi:protein dithiol:quinone oxidoreductase